ncbi:MAG: 30S ribosomal protein S8 [Candidatus Dojkabacteria bacterium]|nr:30S ribosomal protein S8 [Candidatus Dojkabacteria bacterium]
MNDYISDLLARLKNGIMRRKESIEIPSTKMVKEVVKVLEDEGMIESFEELESGEISVKPLYTEKGEPVIENFIRVSKPGQRIYVTHTEIVPIMNGRGISIISTSSGVMSGALAKSKKIGGELICKVW